MADLVCHCQQILLRTSFVKYDTDRLRSANIFGSLYVDHLRAKFLLASRCDLVWLEKGTRLLEKPCKWRSGHVLGVDGHLAF